MNDLSRQRILLVVDALQAGLPLIERPFQAIGESVGLTEAEVLDAARDARREGLLSRVGPVWDGWMLGFSSALFALMVSPEKTVDAARMASEREEVTHCYERDDPWNLWFTATAGNETVLDALSGDATRQEGVLGLMDLRTVRRYKVDARFSLSWAAFNQPAPSRRAEKPHRPCGEDVALLSSLREDLDLEARPFDSMAAQLGLSQDSLIETLKRFAERGWIRRFGGVISHRAAGFTHNALLFKDSSIEEAEAVGGLLAGDEAISHLYLRRQHPGRNHVLCAMLHCRSSQELDERLSRLPFPRPFRLLRTLRCFKKGHGLGRLLARA